MAYKDNREYIVALQQEEDVIRVKEEVDWDLEAGAIVRKLNEIKGPAVLFERVKHYPQGYRIFGGPIATQRRLAIALGIAPETPMSEMIKEYSDRTNKPIKPVLVRKAPCQENVVKGDDVNLFDFPFPMVHEGDGGRYTSWHITVAKDPDEGWVNWGMYRQMIHNRTHLGGLMLPFSDMGRIFYGKYAPKKKPMPFATAIGVDPISALIGMTPISYGVSEADIAGGLRKEPIELVKCVSCDLEVPAHAEIVLEGEILPEGQVDEGPFGEFTGYRTAARMPRNVYRVHTITFRNDPIITMSNMGIPTDDSCSGSTLVWSAEVSKLLKSQGFPITGVYAPPFAAGALMYIVGVKTTYSHIALHIANCIFGSKFTGPWAHMVLVVDEDVDPYNLDEVFHAFSTKCHPVRGIKTYDRAPSAPLMPYLDFEERKWSSGAKVVFDCTWPLQWPRHTTVPQKSSFKTVYPEEVQRLALDKLQRYGIK